MESPKAKICVPVCVRRTDETENAVKRATEIADVIELRFDCLDAAELKQGMNQYAGVRATASQPFIVTFRPAAQGGFRDLTADERVNFWREVARSLADSASDFADIEAEILIDESVGEQIGMDKKRIICSHHDFVAVPNNLSELYERMVATGAAILKIAVQADDATDCIPVFRLLERAQRDGRKMIAIAMGEAGIMTRILGPSRGSFLTYGSLDDESATAPGQPTAHELREVYRIDHINQQTQITGLIGRPIAHSISPHIHNAAFADGGVDAVFIPLEVHDVDGFIRRMVRPGSRESDWNLRGLSVTAPHKAAVIQHLNWIDPAVKEMGAVNTIVVERDELHGYNTDATGFIAPLKERSGSVENLRCAVLGAGGAARAVIWALRNEGASVTLFARDRDKGKLLADQFKVDCDDLADAQFKDFDLLVNTTPLGTRGETEAETAATADQLRGVRWAYDLVYNPLETRFLREARAAGCETIGGLEMLIGQAVEQFKLWTGREPDVAVMRAAAQAALRK